MRGTMKTLTALALISLTAAFSSQAVASGEYYSDQYHTLQTVELYEITEDVDGNEIETLQQREKLPSGLDKVMAATSATNKSGAGLGEILMVTKELIALGEKVYEIIEKGKPVVSIDSSPVSVLPRDLKGRQIDSFALSNWKMPRVKKYKVVASNYLGMKPVSFEFMMIFTYGGKYEGKGSYITGAQIKPTNVEVSWGYTLDAKFSVQSVMNLGSSENPVAAAVLSIDYTIKTLLKESRQSRSFLVSGMGQSQAY